ncbi:MAG TPA: response regulator [Actinobacteria bacterium]|nr:response regulator [Actinomycetota bacterium]
MSIAKELLMRIGDRPTGRWRSPTVGLRRNEGVAVSKRVLVVEDSQVIQRLIEVCLRPAGFEIELRSDGPSGLEAALEAPPDLLILDVGLPGIDGWEVLSRLRSNERTKDVVVLVLTAHAQEETRAKADQGGADAFLTKPFRPAELRAIAAELTNPEFAARSVG